MCIRDSRYDLLASSLLTCSPDSSWAPESLRTSLSSLPQRPHSHSPPASASPTCKTTWQTGQRASTSSPTPCSGTSSPKISHIGSYFLDTVLLHHLAASV